MKKGLKMFLAGAAAVAAGAFAMKKYRDSYEQIVDEDESAEAAQEDDFVPAEEISDEFDYYVEDMEQIMFHE